MTPHPLLAPWTLRDLRLQNRILQAPLAGYGHLPFRLQCRIHGRPGLVATEMISAAALHQGNPRNAFYLERHPEEGPVQYQLWGADPAHLAEGTRRCRDAGADAVDLNSGCPVRKVLAAGAGVALMRDPAHLARCVAAMRGATDAPVSAKIRLGPDPRTPNALEVARAVEDAGADLLTVHGRLGGEAYNVPARADAIAAVVAAVGIPVVANGDVADGPSADRLQRATGCAGVMVGRACMGDPWVFARIRTELAGAPWTPPTVAERGEALVACYRMLHGRMGEDRATRHIRKLASFWSKGLPGARVYRLGLNDCPDAASFLRHTTAHFGLDDPA
ncbi:MAG: tRNA dihydrouridine synthase [Planctomycetota bacterium]